MGRTFLSAAVEVDFILLTLILYSRPISVPLLTTQSEGTSQQNQLQRRRTRVSAPHVQCKPKGPWLTTGMSDCLANVPTASRKCTLSSVLRNVRGMHDNRGWHAVPRRPQKF